MCSEDKPEHEFYLVTNYNKKKTKSWTYRRTECKKCNAAVARVWHNKNRKRAAVNMRRYYLTNLRMFDYTRIKTCARKRGATEFCTEQEWTKLREGGTCAWCKCELHPS